MSEYLTGNVEDLRRRLDALFTDDDMADWTAEMFGAAAAVLAAQDRNDAKAALCAELTDALWRSNNERRHEGAPAWDRTQIKAAMGAVVDRLVAVPDVLLPALGMPPAPTCCAAEPAGWIHAPNCPHGPTPGVAQEPFDSRPGALGR